MKARTPIQALVYWCAVAFVWIAAVLVVVAVIGLRVLGQANARIESLGTLQLRAATYQSLQTQANQLRQLLALRVAGDPSLNTYLGTNVAPTGQVWVLVDHGIKASLSPECVPVIQRPQPCGPSSPPGEKPLMIFSPVRGLRGPA